MRLLIMKLYEEIFDNQYLLDIKENYIRSSMNDRAWEMDG